MKKMKSRNRAKSLLFLLITALILGFGVTPVKADRGPKPSIEVTVKNAPAYKYVTILQKNSDATAANSTLKVENLEKDAVEEFLERFTYDGWKTFVMINKIEVYPKQEGDTYGFYYRVPKPFKVLIIAEDGSVIISPEITQKEFNCEAEYDVSAGTLTEILAGKLIKRIAYIITCFAITIGLELLIFKLFRYPFTKANLLRFFVINIITQIGLNIYIAVSALSMGILGIYTVAEILIAIVEGVFYAITLDTQYDGRKPVRGFLYGVVANVFSYVAGFLVIYFISSVWGWF